jgi:hypothetical protein
VDIVLWAFAASFIALYIFYESNLRTRFKKQARREEMNKYRQELIDNVVKPDKANKVSES